MSKNDIVLTAQELEELKDVIRFREKVILQLKQLNGIPKKVTRLEVHSAVHYAILSVLLSGLLGLCWRVLAK